MGTVQIKEKTANSVNLTQQPKTILQLDIDVNAQILVSLHQLTNWSFSQIKQSFKTFQRISESPMLDSFLFHKIVPLSKKNCDIIFYEFSRGQKYVSVFQFIAVLILTSYQTYRSKFQLFYLLFDLNQSGLLHGRQLLLIFQSLFFGYLRLTGQKFPSYSTLSKFSKANFFPGEELQYTQKEINLRRLIDEYEGNKQVSAIFNRFEQDKFKQIKENFKVFSQGGLRKNDKDQIQKIYRIIHKAYSKGDFQELSIIQSNRQFRRQNRRDSCYQKIIKKKQLLTPLKKSASIGNPELKTHSKSCFRIKKIQQAQRNQGSPKQHLIFLNGNTYSKKQIFQTISYFKTLSGSEDVIKIKQFFKRFDKKAFLKKQISSIFKFLDGDKKGQITLLGFFKSFYPGIQERDIELLKKWFNNYQQIYEADSLARNKPKVIVMSDARSLPTQTLNRIQEIFNAMDISKKGYLNFEDLRKAYRIGFTADQIQKMLKDYGKSNKITIGGLCRMLLPIGWSIEGVDIDSL